MSEEQPSDKKMQADDNDARHEKEMELHDLALSYLIRAMMVSRTAGEVREYADEIDRRFPVRSAEPPCEEPARYTDEAYHACNPTTLTDALDRIGYWKERCSRAEETLRSAQATMEVQTRMLSEVAEENRILKAEVERLRALRDELRGVLHAATVMRRG